MLKCRVSIVILTLLISGCTSSSGVIPDGRDAFRISHPGDTGFTNSNTLQANAYKESSAFCAVKGKVVETLKMETKQAQPMGGWTDASLWFRYVNRAESEKSKPDMYYET